MPYTESQLPFSGSTPQSRHASRLAADEAAPRAMSQVVRYLAILQDRGGLTDLEASALLNIRLSSINARRAVLVKAGLVVADGYRDGPTGNKNTVWTLAGRGAQQ